MTREQTSLPSVKDWMRQVWRRWGRSKVTTKSLLLEEPTNCATCQVLLAGMAGASGGVGDWARAMVAGTRENAKRVRMRRMVRCGMDSLLRLGCVDETWRCACGGPYLGQFRECHRQRRR